MEEIAATFREADLPDQFHIGAAVLYAMLEEFKDQAEPAQIEHVLEALIGSGYRPKRKGLTSSQYGRADERGNGDEIRIE